MPINYSRKLTGKVRLAASNRQLSFVLATLAGAVNAGGFLAVKQYTSHMTGIVSSMADQVALGMYALALAGLGALFAFLCGAATCAVMVNYARRSGLHSQYALPLMLEAVLLLCFGLLGARLAHFDGVFLPVTVMLLSFIMGLQNALVTKLSMAEIRTTHITGIVTDIGIELGKLAYRHAAPDLHPDAGTAPANGARLVVLSTLLALFFLGGVLGALGFKQIGFAMTVPGALILAALAAAPIADDLASWGRRLRHQGRK
jgi:uncharacterized membrane protein YoaK (UPF0700 family)